MRRLCHLFLQRQLYAGRWGDRGYHSDVEERSDICDSRHMVKAMTANHKHGSVRRNDDLLFEGK